jgi:hypothetical protein
MTVPEKIHNTHSDLRLFWERNGGFGRRTIRSIYIYSFIHSFIYMYIYIYVCVYVGI